MAPVPTLEIVLRHALVARPVPFLGWVRRLARLVEPGRILLQMRRLVIPVRPGRILHLDHQAASLASLARGQAVVLLDAVHVLLGLIRLQEHLHVQDVLLGHGLALLRQAVVRAMLVHGPGQVQHHVPHALRERGQLQQEHPALLLV